MAESRLDSLGVLDALRGAPEQLATAHGAAGEQLEHLALPDRSDIDHVVVVGMGGSGVVGDIVAAAGAPMLPVPVTVLKQYGAPASIGPRTLVVAVSYSGNTDETLSMAQCALDAGAALLAVSNGGALADLARAHHAPYLPCLDGIPMPRLALGALVAPVIVALVRTGLWPEAHSELVMAQRQLAVRRDQCHAEIVGPQNPARELARRIGRTIPLVYGAGGLAGVAAMRWKQAFNENAKAPAFWNTHPELEHNEICGWGQHGDVTRQLLTLIVLRHGLEDARLDSRVQVSRELTEEAFASVLEVDASGEGRLAQLLDLVHLGDWTSAYLALENDVDPGPVDAITRLKASSSKTA